VQRFRGGLIFKAHRLLNHSTLGLRVIKKKKKRRFIRFCDWPSAEKALHLMDGQLIAGDIYY